LLFKKEYNYTQKHNVQDTRIQTEGGVSENV